MFVLIEKMLGHVLDNGYTQFDGEHFLQITGSAMGTPSAPTLANITLAMVDDNFVTNHRNILFFKRYIDDIFYVVQANPKDSDALIISRIYTDMQLKVTCNTAVNSVEFLDIVIHKGARWLKEGKFDLYTHQKKLNLYGYMPFRSAHPIHTKRGSITGELLRYIATNTDEHKFKQLRQKNTFGYVPEDIPTRSCSQFSQEQDTRNAP
ncbi:unnamed protein product, partial [Sphacelaria rigidula]